MHEAAGISEQFAWLKNGIFVSLSSNFITYLKYLL